MDVSKHIFKDNLWEKKRDKFYKDPTINPYSDRKIYVNGPIYKKICLAFNKKQSLLNGLSYHSKYFTISTPSPIKNIIEKDFIPLIRNLLNRSYITDFGKQVVKYGYKYYISYINQLNLTKSLIQFNIFVDRCLKLYKKQDNGLDNLLSFIQKEAIYKQHNKEYNSCSKEIQDIFLVFRILAKYYYDMGVNYNLGQEYLDIARITRSIVDVDIFLICKTKHLRLKVWEKYLSYYPLIDNLMHYIS